MRLIARVKGMAMLEDLCLAWIKTLCAHQFVLGRHELCGSGNSFAIPVRDILDVEASLPAPVLLVANAPLIHGLQIASHFVQSLLRRHTVKLLRQPRCRIIWKHGRLHANLVSHRL